MALYLLIDSSNVIQNVIDYDGVSDYSAPVGQILVVSNGQHIGDTYNSSVNIVVVPTPMPPQGG